MLRHRLQMQILDLLLIGVSYGLIILFKDAPSSYLTPKYLWGLAVFSGLWFFISLGFKKFFPKRPISNSGSAHIITVNLFIIGIVAIITLGINSVDFSRLILFGTTAVLTVLEIITAKIYLLLTSNGNAAVPVPLNGAKRKKLSSRQASLKAAHKIMDAGIYLSEEQLKKDISEECGELAYDYISKNINLLDPRNHVVSTTTRFNIMYQPENYLNGIINLKKVNDIPDINKFFEAVNARLPEKGRFILCAETKNQRKNRLLKKYPADL